MFPADYPHDTGTTREVNIRSQIWVERVLFGNWIVRDADGNLWTRTDTDFRSRYEVDEG